ncbi:hypothetical protein AB9H26_16570 [Yersinia enterocolitica]|uniref:hypothetical protein n=1 Tax=Yersinia enterocolitica TaxID=630 RepID=UPI0028DFEDE7|nr:hypothetical protein [Yersinia enterocolitica]HDZ9834029.1 hypothetical protein [Yersinia enterocolitica]HEC1640656.1 hypothetical protein [Yersinia enterocolitica]HEN3296763.1 hypothetical protein [Yersinia enterocolitica]
MILKKINYDFIILLLGRLVQVFITLITLRVLTTVLPKSELGFVYYIITIQTFYSLFFINPVGQFFNRNTISWYEKGSIINCLRRQFIYIIAISISAVVTLFMASYLNFINLTFDNILLISFLILALSSNQTVIPLLNMIGKRIAFVNLNLLTGILSFIFSLSLVCFFSKNSQFWVLGVIVSNLLMSVISFIYLRVILKKESYNLKNINLSYRFYDIISIAKFSVPISIATLFMWYLNAGYRIQVENNYGLAYLAVIGIGLSISNQVFNIAESILTQYMIPGLYKDIEGAGKDKVKLIFNNYLNVIIPVYLFLAILLSFSIKNTLPFLVNESFSSGYGIIIFGAWIEFLRVVTNALALASQIERKTSSFIPAYFLGGIFLLVIFELFPGKEYFVCIKLLLANIVVAISMALMMKKLINFNISFRKIFKAILYSIPSSLFFYYAGSFSGLNFINFTICLIGSVISLYSLIVYWKYNVQS